MNTHFPLMNTSQVSNIKLKLCCIISFIISFHLGCSSLENDPRPSDQIEFINNVYAFQNDFKLSNGNEIRLKTIGEKAIIFLDEPRDFHDWIGTISEVNDVYGEVVVTVSFSILQPKGNSLGGANIQGYIKGVAPSLASSLLKGEVVKFSGHIKRESSLTASGAIENPELSIDGNISQLPQP